MRFYDTNDNSIVGYKQIIKKYNISNPPGKSAVDKTLLTKLGIVPLKDESKPEINEFQSLEHGEILYKDGDEYAVHSWNVIELYVDEVDESGKVIKTRDELLQEEKERREAQIKAREEAEAQAKLEEQKELENKKILATRKHRDSLLLLSDRYSLSDYPHSSAEAKAEWTKYRQALRDITDHENWPDLEEADWPVAPTS